MRKKRKQAYLDDSEIELDDLGNHNCQARQAVNCPGSARRLNSINEEPENPITNRCEVTRNVSPTQEGLTKNDVCTESVKNEEVSGYRVTTNATSTEDNVKVNAKENDVNKASRGHLEVEWHQVTRNALPVQEKNGENINDLNAASGRNRKADWHQGTRNATSSEDKVSENDVNKANESYLEVDKHQVTGNLSSVQEKNVENINGFNTVSGRNRKADWRQITTYATSTEDKVGENENDVNKANGSKLEVDRHQVTRNDPCNEDKEGIYRNGINIASRNYNFQIRCPPGTSANNQCIPEESNQVFQRDNLDVQYLDGEHNGDKVIENKNDFLDKCEFQLRGPFESNAGPHPTNPDSAQALIHSTKLASIRRTRQRHAIPEHSFRADEENCRRDTQLRDVTHKRSSLDQRVAGDKQRLKDLRSEYLHSHGVKNREFWIIIGGLFMTFLTAVSVVIAWEYLSIVFLRHRLSSNSSSIPQTPGTDFSRT